MLGLLRLPASLLAAQQGHLFPWAPVAFGTGIGVYFAWPGEPERGALWLLAGLALGLAIVALRAGTLLGPLLWALALTAAGFAAAATRSARVAAPVLGFRYYGPVEGRIVGIDRSASDALRLTLDRVILLRVDPQAVPERVRLSLHGDPLGLRPIPGARISATAHLSPPSGPVEPGGFDFRRHAWFARLGALGYTSVPALLLAPPDQGEARVPGWRLALADRVRAALPGETGAFGAAVMTGDRSGMGQATLTALRRSNLAHLLAISGLHMGLLAGFVFGAVRLALACWPWAALRWPLHKIAALVALLAAAGYLVLSGGSVATERAFVMVAVALGAVLGNRRALSLRAVALAALIVLGLRPEALLSPGFQMSFAATLALVAAFDLLRRRPLSGRWRWLAPVLAVVLSSAVAGAATAPVAAVHFNQIARLGLLANLLAVPVMGLVVMPAAVVSACLMPLGLAAPALWVMGQGLGWILEVATQVAARPEALVQVPTPGAAVLPLLAVGGLLLCLWRGRLRLAGLAPMALALWLWAGVERPALLVDESGGLVGVMTAQGRALSRASGSGFVAQTWLENDGDGADQAQAAARWALVSEDLVRHVTGRKRVAGLRDCDGAALLVSNAPAPRLSPCLVLDSTRLRRTGAVALHRDGGITTASGQVKGRPWAPSGKSVEPLVLPALPLNDQARAAQ